MLPGVSDVSAPNPELLILLAKNVMCQIPSSLVFVEKWPKTKMATSTTQIPQEPQRRFDFQLLCDLPCAFI